MVLRTARSGRNAGGKFWGCSRYPRCKSTIDYGQSGGGVHGTGAGQNGVETLSLPRILVARSLIQGYQSKFFESVAVTQSLREELSDSPVSDDHLRAVSQWRVDFPPTQKFHNWTETERQILAVAEKLLTRGRLTLCSPFIETKLQSVFGRIVAQASEFENCVLTNSNISDGHCWLDSPAEQLFYNDVLPKVLGSGFSRWVLPQVEIASLVPDSSQEIQGRVDFLICYPSIHPVIVEIDGSQHLQHESSDNERTELLQKHGYKVITITAQEIETKKDVIIANLKEILNTADKVIVTEPSVVKQLYSIKRCHQIELVILQAIQSGFLSFSKIDSWHVTVSAGHIFLEQEQDAIIDVAIDDIRQLLKNLFNLYGYTGINSDVEDNHIHIAFDSQMSAPSTFLVQDIMVPFHIASTAFSSGPAELTKPDKTVLEFFLDYVFRKPVFWEGQADAITRTLEGKDSIILLPTGAGKSIAFQLASLLLPGRTVVIDPIVSLMDDQIDNLESLGIDRCIAITSQISDPEDKTRVLNLFGQGEYLFAYVAPERFQTTDFRKSLRALTVHTPIAVIAIDEAHCISEWGHDFRTAYLNIGRISETVARLQSVLLGGQSSFVAES